MLIPKYVNNCSELKYEWEQILSFLALQLRPPQPRFGLCLRSSDWIQADENQDPKSWSQGLAENDFWYRWHRNARTNLKVEEY